MRRLALLSIAALTASAVYLYAWPAANMFYAAVVLLHVRVGIGFCIGGLFLIPYMLQKSPIAKLGALVLAIGAVLGLLLICTGTSRPHTKLLYEHILASALAVVLLSAWWFSRRPVVHRSAWALALPVLLAAGLISIEASYSRNSWSKHFQNPQPGNCTRSHGTGR